MQRLLHVQRLVQQWFDAVISHSNTISSNCRNDKHQRKCKSAQLHGHKYT